MCEYEITAYRKQTLGSICTLTRRGCFIENELDKPKCHRRLWANQYQYRNTSEETSREYRRAATAVPGYTGGYKPLI